MSGHEQDTATAPSSVRPPLDDALVLIERGVTPKTVPFTRHAEVRVVDFGQHVAHVVADFPLKRLAIVVVVRDTPRRDIRAVVRELLALGADSNELHVHRVEPSRVTGGVR